MRKLIVILLFIPVFCQGQDSLKYYGASGIENWLSYSTGPNLAREGLGVIVDLTDTIQKVAKVGWGSGYLVGVGYAIWRIGLIFDVSELPYKSVVDSVKLGFYSDNNLEISTIIAFYNSPKIDPDNVMGYTDITRFQNLVHSTLGIYTWMKAPVINKGWNEIVFYDAPFSSIYSRTISIGIGMVFGDAVPPFYPLGLDANWIDIDETMELTIYYRGGGTPSPKKIKIIGVI